MKYNESTGNYQSEFLEKILDTNYLYGVPYKIDRGKYEAAMEAFDNEVRIKDADVVVFSSDYNADEDKTERGIYSYAFFVSPQNSPEGSEDFYDVAQFWDWDYENSHKKFFEQFVHALLESVIEIDKGCLKKLKEETIDMKSRIEQEIKIIESLECQK